jgi:hypothetical protein
MMCLWASYKNKIWIRIHESEVRIQGSRTGSGSAPKCHGSPTLLQVEFGYLRYGKARDADVEPAVVVDDKKLIQEMKMTERLQFTSYGTWDNGKVSHLRLPYLFFFFTEISGFGPISFLDPDVDAYFFLS